MIHEKYLSKDDIKKLAKHGEGRFPDLEKKLSQFQKEITDRNHIDRVSAFIPAAQRYADANAKSESMWIKLYSREMNRLTSEAGLRCI